MEMEERATPPVRQVCILCCDLLNIATEDEGTSEEIVEFVREVILRDGKREVGLKEEDWEVLKTLPVCDSCGEVMMGAAEKKKEVKGTEEKIKELRQLLMEETRKLEGILKEYYGEMKRMEGILKTSEGKRLEDMVNKKGGDQEEEGDQKEVSVVKNLRGLILEAVRDLDDKQSDNEEGDNSKIPRRPPTRKSRGQHLETDLGEEEDDLMSLRKCTVKLEADSDEDDLKALLKEEEMSNASVKEEEETPEIEQENEDEELGELRRKKRKGSHIYRSDCDPLEDDDDKKDIENEEDPLGTSDSDFFFDEGEDDVKSESDSSQDSEEESANEDSDEGKEGKEKGREEPKRKRIRKSRRQNETVDRILDSIAFSRMSLSKRNLIKRVIFKKYSPLPKKLKTPGKASIPDPRQGHFIEYDPLTDTFSLDGIFIKVLESPTEELSLECSLCSWRARPRPKCRHSVDRFMFDHIAGHHLNLFQCVTCGSVLGGYSHYTNHVLGHRRGFSCDICGRPLSGPQSLATHKWSHLNAQEAAELVSLGQKDPREKKVSQKSFPCATCGKSYPYKCQLKKHEKVHSQNREKVTCDVCGKLFMASGFPYHKRYYCQPPGVDQPRVPCPQCPQIFPTKQYLQYHLASAHGTERSHKCPECGKGFKTERDVKRHLKTHETNRPLAFACGKGCGRSFRVRRTWRGHEEKCDGRGGVLIQRFLDEGQERQFGCRKGCARAFKTARTRRGHEKICKGVPFLEELLGRGGDGGKETGC